MGSWLLGALGVAAYLAWLAVEYALYLQRLALING
jgi:hypothetical protein